MVIILTNPIGGWIQLALASAPVRLVICGSIINELMKTKLLLTSISLLAASPLGLVMSCSTVSNQNTTISTEEVLTKELTRIASLNLTLKQNQPVSETFIRSLNKTNLLEHLDNWTPGTLDDSSVSPFRYEVDIFHNGLGSPAPKTTSQISFTLQVSYQTTSRTTTLLKVPYQLQAIAPSGQLNDPTGGFIPGTHIRTSHYNNLLTTLNLFDDQTYLPTITNAQLAAALAAWPNLATLKITIVAGETTTGTLKLHLKGLLIDKPIEQVVTLSGFATYDNANHEYLQYGTFLLDANLWFDKQFPIVTSADLATAVAAISSSDWNKLLSDFDVFKADNHFNFVGKKTTLMKMGFDFDIKAIADNGNIKFTIVTTYQHQSFINNQWTAGERLRWPQASYTGAQMPVPTAQELQQFLIDQTEVNKAHLAAHYPSYYLGLQNWYRSQNENLWTISDLFTNRLFDNAAWMQYYFGPNSNVKIVFANEVNIQADDLENHLTWTVKLSQNDQPLDVFKTFSFQKANRELKPWIDAQGKVNQVMIKPEGSFFNKIIRVLKQSKAKIDELFANQGDEQFTINDIAKGRLVPAILERPLARLDDNIQNVIENFAKITNQITPKAFNQDIEEISVAPNNNRLGAWNYHSHLFINKPDDAFVIENVQYGFDDQLDLNIFKYSQNPNLIVISISASTLVQLADDKELSQDTKFSLILLKSKWESLKDNF